MAERTCGKCYACCVHLGVEALRKHVGVSCKHLSGTIPTKRCTIYADRPTACQAYRCHWLNGFASENDRPDKSRIIIGAYALPDEPNKISFSITQFKAEANSTRIASMLVEAGFDDIRIANYATGEAWYWRGGEIRAGKLLLKPDGFEDLKFEAYNPPIARYILREAPHD